MVKRRLWWAAVTSLSLAIACGPATDEGGAPIETLNAGADRLFLAEGDPGPANALSTVSETALLTQFWAIDRFVLDGDFGVPIISNYDTTLLAKAQPDECFVEIGKPMSAVPDAQGKCAEGQVPKTNDAYVWGLTRSGDNIFFGTLSNTLCLVEQGFLGMTTSQETGLWVCDPTRTAAWPLGDLRFPNTFMYSKAGGIVSLNDRTDAATKITPSATAPMIDTLRKATTGLRSAGSLGGVVFLAGPSVSGGVNFLAYDANGNSLGGYTYKALTGKPGPYVLSNVRQWVVANGRLYVGVGATKRVKDQPTEYAGAILKWVGSAADPFKFEEVGYLPDDAANMIFHTDGRIYMTTWPGTLPAGLYRSPVVPKDGVGLTAASSGDASWTTPLWLATKVSNPAYATVPWYDPDPLTGQHYGGGALASYKDRIYFGTMHVPFVAAQDAAETYALPQGDLLRTALGTHRSIALFEVKLPANNKVNVSMIFGEKYLPVYDAAAGGYTIRYDVAHKTGFVPRWGSSGFGNFFNTYTWAMAVHRGEVFVGTFDWSQLARAMIETIAGEPQASAQFIPVQIALLNRFGTVLPREGADLVRFSDDRVVAESATGLGNDRNYGVRNLLTDGKVLYVGTANPMNLDPKGGWELLQMMPR